MSRRARFIFSVCGLVASLTYAGVTVRSAQRRTSASVFNRSGGPEPAARFLADNAPPGSRVFNAFDDGPWLMWFGRPDISYYIDPRNQLGAAHLSRYTTLLGEPSQFDKTVKQLSMNLALIPQKVSMTKALQQHLGAAGDWNLVFWDGAYSLFARVTRTNEELIEHRAYRVLRPTLDLSYLDSSTLSSESFAHDVSQLRKQSELLADVVQAYAVLRSPNASTTDTQKAKATIVKAWPLLPEIDGFERALLQAPLAERRN